MTLIAKAAATEHAKVRALVNCCLSRVTVLGCKAAHRRVTKQRCRGAQIGNHESCLACAGTQICSHMQAPIEACVQKSPIRLWPKPKDVENTYACDQD